MSIAQIETKETLAPSTTTAGGPLDLAWRALASERMTAVLVLLMSIAALIATLIPQGGDAIELAKSPTAVTLHRLVSLGLTEVFSSSWVYATGALLLGNLIAVSIAVFGRARVAASARAPSRVPHTTELRAAYPERAVEQVRGIFSARLGAPVAEEVEGSRVRMVFESGSSGALQGMLAHLGLLLLVVSAGLYGSTADGRSRVPRALLAITDARTGTTGNFDMVAGESFQLFQYPARFVLRNYVPDRGGLGPAVRIERFAPGREQQGSDFWVYLDAPKGFDARHRRSEVNIDPIWMGMSPMPGAGVVDSILGVVMLAGLALIGLGAFGAPRAAGRLWVDAEGDRIVLSGVPQRAADRDFEKRFERWAGIADETLNA